MSSIVRVGVAVILVRNQHILFGLRRAAHGLGQWAFPGGHLEWGESPEECARRECLEETGMTLAQFRRVAFTNDIFADSGRHYITLFLKGEAGDEQEPINREPDKCQEWRWFPVNALPQPLFSPIAHFLADGHRF